MTARSPIWGDFGPEFLDLQDGSKFLPREELQVARKVKKNEHS